MTKERSQWFSFKEQVTLSLIQKNNVIKIQEWVLQVNRMGRCKIRIYIYVHNTSMLDYIRTYIYVYMYTYIIPVC